jgi:hypothetical protein
VNSWKHIKEEVKEEIANQIIVSCVLIFYSTQSRLQLNCDNHSLIVTCNQLTWNFANITDKDKKKEKIWHIAQERYRGWRSNLSATYRAHNTYAERIRHVPEEVNLLEWHYLLLYFGSNKFKVTTILKSTLSNKLLHCYMHLPVLSLQKVSSQNSSNRHQQKTTHVMGSKNFSQCSFEQVINICNNVVHTFL